MNGYMVMISQTAGELPTAKYAKDLKQAKQFLTNAQKNGKHAKIQTYNNRPVIKETSTTLIYEMPFC